MASFVPVESPWWNKGVNGAQFRMPPLPLTNHRIALGEDPTKGMTPGAVHMFDAFINLHEEALNTFEPYPHKRQGMYWYPIDEMGVWTYEMFYAVFKTLDYHMDKGHAVYLHCQYGQNRSPIVLMLYLKYKGVSFRHSEILKHSAMPSTMRYYLSQLVKGGHIPRGLRRFIRIMKKYPGMTLGQVRAKLENRWD